MESIYWVMAWACHRACRHCYETRFRPYVRADLEAVVAQAEANAPRVIANLPDRMTYRDGAVERIGRIVLSGGEALLDAVRGRVTYKVIDSNPDAFVALKVINAMSPRRLLRFSSPKF